MELLLLQETNIITSITYHNFTNQYYSISSWVSSLISLLFYWNDLKVILITLTFNQYLLISFFFNIFWFFCGLLLFYANFFEVTDDLMGHQKYFYISMSLKYWIKLLHQFLYIKLQLIFLVVFQISMWAATLYLQNFIQLFI